MNMFSGIEASASGMTAERLRMDVISNNIANVNTTRTTGGGPYRRRVVVFEPRNGEVNAPFAKTLANEITPKTGQGVRAVGIVEDATPSQTVYDPSHPDANQDGYVEMPNLNIVSEMVDMITASRAYEANVTAVNTAKSMAMKALDIGK